MLGVVLCHHIPGSNRVQLYWALSYYRDLMLSQYFQPMAVQLSLKAAVPLAKIFVTASCRSSKTGPCALQMYHTYFFLINRNCQPTAHCAASHFDFKKKIVTNNWQYFLYWSRYLFESIVCNFNKARASAGTGMTTYVINFLIVHFLTHCGLEMPYGI